MPPIPADNLEREWELFDAAIEAPPDRRDDLLRDLCRDDASMIARIRSLLAAHDQGPPSAAPGPAIRAGAMIGEYRVRRLISEGAMGAVYEAEQSRPRRVVAIKLLRASLATGRRSIARFEREADALGRLRHPGIARIYDVGVVETDLAIQRFLVMERVEGVPVTRFVGDHASSMDDRVRLLADICEAVDHAHQAGVIHRDLKPANILVERTGQPKILDFGLARLEDDPTDSLRTGTGEVFGTLPYMSPEQVAGDPSRVDGRTDVYALGVLGYEILCGRRPLAVDDLPLVAASRVIQEQEPIALGAVDRSLRGDVETIISTAMAKEKERRYATPAALAEDLRRHLAHVPIAARPASAFYQVRKFTARHRTLVASVATALLALATGLILALFALDRARTERARFEEINRVFRDMLASSNPDHDATPGVTLREFLDRTSVQIGRELADRPAIRSPIEETIGVAYMGLGELALAQRHLGLARQAAALADEDDPRWSIDAANAELAYHEGRLDDAIAIATRVLDALTDEDDRRLRCRVRAVRGYAYLQRTRFDDCRRDFEANQAESAGQGTDEALQAEIALAQLDTADGRFEAAYERLTAAIATSVDLYGDDSQPAANARAKLSPILRQLSRYDDALNAAERTAADMRRIYGPNHSRYANALLTLGNAQSALGEREQSVRTLVDAVSAYQQSVGEGHPHLAIAKTQLATNLIRLGRSHEAIPLLDDALAIYERADAGSTRHADALGILGRALLGLGRPDEAEERLTEALAVQHRILGPDHPELTPNLSTLAKVALSRDDLDGAERMLRRCVDIDQADPSRSGAQAASNLTNLGVVVRDQGRLDEAEPLLRRAVDACVAAFSPGHRSLNDARIHLALCLERRESFAAAADQLAEVIESPSSSLSADEMAKLLRWRGRALMDADQATLAVDALRASLEAWRQLRPEDDAEIVDTKTLLATALDDAGRRDEADHVRSELPANR